MTTEALDIAMQHHMAGRLPQAEEIYRQLLERKPNDHLILHLLGVLADQVGKYDLAVEFSSKALAVKADFAEAHCNLGNALSALGRSEEAAVSYRHALEIRHDYAEAHCNLGNSLRALGRLGEAEASYRRALAFAPDFAEAHSNLGNALRELGRLREAEESCRRAIAIKLEYAEAHSNLGNALHDLGRLTEAETSYRRALEIKPDVAKTYINLANTLRGLGKIEDAEACYRRVIEIEPVAGAAYGHLVSAFVGQSIVQAQLVPEWHVPMINDGPRNDAYLAALQASVQKNSRVLEIGTGSGLLAMMAARLGVRQVVTCEAVPSIAAIAREIVATNGLAESVRVIGKKSTEITVGVDLPWRADILVSEIFSNDLLSEGVLPSIEDAKRRLLEPNAQIIPAAGSIVFALFGGDQVGKNIAVGESCGFDLSKFNEIVSRKRYLNRADLSLELLTDATEAFSFEFVRHDYFPNERKTLRVPIRAAGRCYGVVQWIRLRMDDRITFENHPSAKNAASGWQQCLYRVPTPFDVLPGQTAIVSAAHNRGSVWFFMEGLEAPP